ncbi:hypothetical protein IMZ48_00045 [Candidatus Bathyarchaeota archaeon]|nr:hypothetical protein [Candidatus Bathyarchaeota archaeon]
MATYSREHAAALDRDDALSFTRDEFFVPTKAEALSESLPERGACLAAGVLLLLVVVLLAHPPPLPPCISPLLEHLEHLTHAPVSHPSMS